MIDIIHTKGCGKLAYRIFAVPVGRDFMAADCMVPTYDLDEEGNADFTKELGMLPTLEGHTVKCASCGENAVLDEAREQTYVEPEAEEEEQEDDRTDE